VQSTGFLWRFVKLRCDQWKVQVSLESTPVNLHRLSLTVQPFVTQTSTSAVMVSLLQLQAMSVNAQGEAAITSKRQSRYIEQC
jgi:hypothetical protein